MTSGARALNGGQGNLFEAMSDFVGAAPRAPKTKAAPFVRPRTAPAMPLARSYAMRESLVEMRARLLNGARQRVFGLVLAFVALTSVALVQILWLGLDGGTGPSRPQSANASNPARGEILDRNGTPLARAYPAYSLYFHPKAMNPDGSDPLVRSPRELARELTAIFPDLDEVDVARKLAAGQGTTLRRRILPEEANAVWALGELALQSPEIQVRHYPQGRLAAHVIGRVKDDGDTQVGLFGMEAFLNERFSDPATAGDPVALSIDVRVQGALEDEMGRGMKLANADGAAGVVLDVETGEVLAFASLPDFDPNRVPEDEKLNLNNRVTWEVQELGSVFKPLTVAAAIDAGVVSDLSRVWDASPVEAGGRSFPDHEDKGDRLTIPEALAYSSNTVTMRVAEKLGGERLRQVWLDLGMAQPVDIEIKDKGLPDWPDEKRWSRMTTMIAAYGHGFDVTPLHLANAYAAMVNGGVLRPATLLKVAPGEAQPGTRVFKASTSQKMRQLLRLIAKYGTGKNAHENAIGFRVGGKTGSAEKLIDGRYSRTRIVSTFAAAFPMDRPRYVVVVSLDEPKITHAVAGRTAFFNAAPIVGNLIRRTGPMLGVRPDHTRDLDVSEFDHLLKDRK
ncbi:MAG: penicillin-binding protein 2 [Pseudomonadota bacterium]